MKRCKKIVISLYLSAFLGVQAEYNENQRMVVEFTDFPLKKMDKLYPRHVAQATKFLFDLWYWLSYFEHVQSNETLSIQARRSIPLPKHPDVCSSSQELSDCFKKLVTPSLATLRPVKTFVKKIVAEWCRKTGHSQDVQELMLEILLIPDTSAFEKLFCLQDHALLRALTRFLHDGMKNIPQGVQECKKMISAGDMPYYEKFIQEEPLVVIHMVP